MAIAFSEIPPNTLLPLFYAEITQAAEPVSSNLKLCLIGSMNKDALYGEGSAAANIPYLITGKSADSLFGRGSMLSWMYQRARANAPFAEIWAIAIPEDVDAIRSVGTITVVRTVAKPLITVGNLYIAGRFINFQVSYLDTTTQIASRIAARINSADLPVRATVAGAVVTLTCRWAGNTGNLIRVGWVGPLGRAQANDPGAAVSRSILTITQLTGGIGENQASAAFGALMNRPFDVFCSVYQGTYHMLRVEDFMEQRWHPSTQLYGHFVSAYPGIPSTAIAIVSESNCAHHTFLAYKQSICPPWEWAACLAGIMTTHWAAPPELSRPLQTLELKGMAVGDEDDESFTRTERQLLLEYGCSTFGVDRDYRCRIDRVRTLRITNDYGDPDASWADAITMFQAQYFVRQMRAAIQGAFPRCALTDRPTGINGFTSPQEIKQTILHTYKRMQSQGLVEHFELFAQYLVVERDPVDHNRVNVLMRPDMVNQLRVVAAVVETHLELNANDPTLLLPEAA